MVYVRTIPTIYISIVFLEYYHITYVVHKFLGYLNFLQLLMFNEKYWADNLFCEVILRSHNGRDMYAAWLFFGLSIEANKRRGKKKKEKKLAVC